MALINCNECNTEVSDTALKCPKCGFQLRKLKRGFFGKLVKYAFIGFNILMIIWLITSMGDAGKLIDQADSEAARTVTAAGAGLAMGFIITVWAFGDVILGLFVLFTRPKG